MSEAISAERVNYADVIRTVPNYPIEGVMFRDITTLLSHPGGFRQSIDDLVEPHLSSPPDVIAALDARGFIFGGAMADRLGSRLVPLRKEGKLPHDTHQIAYELEYGDAVLEMHADAVETGDRVMIVDDLLATGGTAEAATKLIRKAGGVIIEAAFVIDLPDLGGAKLLEYLGVPVRALVAFEGG